MRHRKGGFKLQRDPSARRALLRGLTTSIILHERIETTVTKAKAVRPQIEKIITLAKRDTLHSRRQAASFLLEPAALKKLFDTVGPRFLNGRAATRGLSASDLVKVTAPKSPLLSCSEHNSRKRPRTKRSVKKND